jgi:hypothetical protein
MCRGAGVKPSATFKKKEVASAEFLVFNVALSFIPESVKDGAGVKASYAEERIMTRRECAPRQNDKLYKG